MASSEGSRTPGPRPEAVLDLVLDVIRALALETGGPRAERAVSPEASLEREVGLGSLERVELVARLERAFGRALDDRSLALDTAAGLARALVEGVPGQALSLPAREAALGAAADIGAGVRTLHESLWRHAHLDPARVHVFLRDDQAGRAAGGTGAAPAAASESEEPITYGRLRDEAAAVAGGLRERGIARGDTVALMLPTGLDFLRAFFGILLARGIPVPIYPPVRLDRLEEYAARQSAILADAGVRLLVTIPRARPVASLLRPAVKTLADVVTTDELAASGVPVSGPEGGGDEAAFIQYTSGSTGQPKGVLLTHDNLLANVRAIAAGLEVRPTDVGVSWLPLYHDMGLIGSWLTCLHHGLPLTLLPPTAFLARPERWLWAIHQRRATLSAAPNFAYELCARRIPDAALEGLDLSSWRVALNGAEPVSRGTIERFARRFSPCGFRPEAMMPVYGLAECSVGLSFPPVGRGPKVDRVARGPFQTQGRAEAAAPGDAERPRVRLGGARAAGARGPHRRRRRRAARRALGGPARVPRPLDDGGLLPPARDDRRDHPARAAGSTAGTSPTAPTARSTSAAAGRTSSSRAAATSCPRRSRRPRPRSRGSGAGASSPSASRTRRSAPRAWWWWPRRASKGDAARERLAGAVTERVAEAVDVPPDQVILVPPGAVPKTSSGKVRRAATREQYLQGALGRPPRTTLAQKARLAASALAEAVRPGVARARRGLYAAWLSFSLPLLLLPAWALVALVPGRRFAFALSRFVARAGLRLLGCRLEVEGLERLPRRGPLVLAANHASYADVAAVLALLPADFLFVAKREVLGYPLIGSFARRCGHLTVDRWDALQSVADAELVAQALRDGEDVLFFPEGTFVAATGLRPFRLGAFLAAATAGAPVVPLALRGTRRVMRGDWGLPRPGRIALWVGEPIAPEGTDMAALVRLRGRVADAIAAHCGEPRLDLVAAGPERPAASA